MSQASLFAPTATSPYVVQKVTSTLALEAYRGPSEAQARVAFRELAAITANRVELWQRGEDGVMYLLHVRAERRL
jgi:hypothetical protein